MKPYLYSVSLLISAFLLITTPPKSYSQSLAINEIMSSNLSTIADEDDDYSDWIELYNYGATAISLQGYGLSDNYNNPFKWIFPEVTIGAGEYLLVWASGKDRRPSQGEPATGILREVYAGITGAAIPNLTNHPSYPDYPTSTNVVHDLFEAPINIGDHYGQRMRGWIKAPVTGQYIFWISSDDNGELHLSTTDSPDDLALIAHVPGWTNPREWNKYSQQQSAPVTLQEGQFYYIMALMKEHEGGDNLAVGWQLPGGAMQRPIPGEHLFRGEAELHTNFSLSSAGEEVLLTHPDGIPSDEIAAVALLTDISYGRSPDGTGELFFFVEPTPGQSNATQTYSEILSPPEFSVSGGFFTQGFDLQITHPDPETTIIYTLDGSIPDIENLDGVSYQYKNSYPQQPGNPYGPLLENTFQSLIYSSPIQISDRSAMPDKLTQISSTWNYQPNYFPSTPVSKGNVVRAVAVKEGAITSRGVSNAYYVFPDGREKYTLPVVSISLQEDSFFEYEKGIYIAGVDFDNWRANNSWAFPNGGTPSNYWRRGEEWEYRANIEVYPAGTDTAALRQDIGVRLHGGWSRSFRNKSLRLYARNSYGGEYFEYAFFPDNPTNQFKRLILRNSGNDADNTLMRDAAIQKIVTGLNFDVQDYQPSVLFINGEYWGIHNFRERYDRHYLAVKYDVDSENLDILTNNAEAKEGDPSHYNAMIAYMQNSNMSQPVHYNYIKTQMDVVNFADYVIAQVFAGNTDWPGNNIDFWRLRTDGYIPGAPPGHDGRWRWLMFDTDFGFWLYGGSPTHNTLAFAAEPNGPGWPNPPWSTLVFRRLLTNPEFELHFVNRFADLLNTTFLSARMVEIINDIRAAIEPEIPAHIHRWSAPQNVNAWNNNVNTMVNYANQRPNNQRQHIRQFFGISGDVNVTVDLANTAHGHIRINTIHITPETHGISGQPYPWTGIYFHGIPIEVEAIAQPGFVFSHWEGSAGGSDPVISITPTGSINLTAHFTEIELPDSDIIHYWHFNDLPSGTLEMVLTDWSFPGAVQGEITYPGTGDGYMDRRTHSAGDPVSNLNLLMEQEPDQGAVLRVRNPSDTRELIISAPSYGFENIQAVFATTRTSNGATGQEVYYSVNGGQDWQLAGVGYVVYQLPHWELRVVDFSADAEANNNPNLQIKILFGGESAGGSSGNNRFDNFSVHGDQLQPALVGIDPDMALQGELVDVAITAEHSFWTAHNPDVFMIFTGTPSLVIEALEVIVTSNETLAAAIEIPSDAPAGLYNLHVDNLILMDAFTVTLTSGINKLQALPHIYPNPASEFLWIETETEATVKIFDLNGQVVLNETLKGGRESISLKALAKGVYVVEVSAAGKRKLQRLVVM